LTEAIENSSLRYTPTYFKIYHLWILTFKDIEIYQLRKLCIPGKGKSFLLKLSHNEVFITIHNTKFMKSIVSILVSSQFLPKSVQLPILQDSSWVCPNQWSPTAETQGLLHLETRTASGVHSSLNHLLKYQSLHHST